MVKTNQNPNILIFFSDSQPVKSENDHFISKTAKDVGTNCKQLIPNEILLLHLHVSATVPALYSCFVLTRLP